MSDRPFTATARQARSLLNRGPDEPTRPWRREPKTATERQAASLLVAPEDDEAEDDRPEPTVGDLRRARRANERLREELDQAKRRS